MGYLPIEDHGVIGNLHTAALVGTDGTIDWLCLPAFDSPSVFCSILDDEKGGYFALRPVVYTHSYQLLPDTNVLLTRFFSPEGLAETLDFMPIVTRPEERHRLVRNVRVIRGKWISASSACQPSTTPAATRSPSGRQGCLRIRNIVSGWRPTCGWRKGRHRGCALRARRG